MINKEELRIGNLFNNNFQITGIHRNAKLGSSKGEDFFYSVYLENNANFKHVKLSFLKPIKLTKKWLIKFGWEEIEPNFFDNISLNVAFEKVDDYFKQYHGYKKIKYVHKLQNYIYELTDINLKIK